MNKLSIIIVNYNVKQFLENLIVSIRKSAQNIQYEIIVVDNASDDGSVEMVKKKFADVNLIANKNNKGFGAANNQALEIATGQYILLINPDTIVKEDTLKKLIKFLNENPTIGMATCKVLNNDGTLQLACRRSFPGPWTSFTKVTGLSKLFPKSKLFAKYNLTYLDENMTYEVDAISGSFMMMRRELYEKIGGFDADFFMYGEDLDFCYRTQQTGFKIYYFHETEIIHYKGESTKRSSIDETNVFYQAMQLFVKKHLSTSFFVSGILRSGIFLRKLFAFFNVFKLIILSLVFDFVLFSAILALAERVYHTASWQGFPPEVKPWIYIFPALFQIIVGGFLGAYKKNILAILKSLISLAVGFFLLSSITFFFKQFAFSRAIFLITYSIAVFAFPLWRIIFKIFFRIGIGNHPKRIKTLIVGTGSRASDLGEKIKSRLTDLYQVAGLISPHIREIGVTVGNFKVIGSLSNIKKVIENEKIDQVIFTSENLEYKEIFSVVAACSDANVEFLLTGNELDFMVGKSSITLLDEIPLMKIEYNIAGESHKILKAVFDKVISSLILLFVFPFIYFLNKITRRSTDFGKFIAGIPQVVLGKKSLVGPLDNAEQSNDENGLYLGKPGLTGLWFTENIDGKDKKELNKVNLFYAKNQNIWLDLELLGKTFSKFFFR